jgi:hypothetical protein
MKACVEMSKTALRSLASLAQQGSQPIKEEIMIYFIDGVVT